MWHWLKDPDDRTVVTWLGSGLVVLAGGAWALFTYIVPPESGGGTAPTVQVERGVGAGGNISVGGDLSISGSEAPPNGAE